MSSAGGEDRDDIRAPHLRSADFLGAFAVLRRGPAFLFVQNRRRIGGRDVLTWDLPGGQVEPGETLVEALVRELDEELDLQIAPEPAPPLLFLQEGERVIGGARSYVWRSFFFAVDPGDRHLEGASEVLAARWVPRAELPSVLQAPYHGSFLSWMRGGGSMHRCRWSD